MGMMKLKSKRKKISDFVFIFPLLTLTDCSMHFELVETARPDPYFQMSLELKQMF